MPAPPTFSLIVPTRSRPAQLRRFINSLAATAHFLDRIEVVLVIDEDDPESMAVRHSRLPILQVVGPAGRTMGALNMAGYTASSGQYIMLMNDDVVVRTRGWDAIALKCFRRFPDPYVLVHVNDTLIKDYLCTFPLVSRAFCELAGGICPEEYTRYRIDDHIEDAFNLLAVLGVRRSVYLPNVVFEHTNAIEHPTAGRVYASDPAILAHDAPLFDSLFAARKELALKLLDRINGGRTDITAARATFAAITDSFALRTAGRQHIVRAPWWKRRPELLSEASRLWSRARQCFRSKGYRGLLGALRQRLVGAPKRLAAAENPLQSTDCPRHAPQHCNDRVGNTVTP
jgi:hypothetical protein